MQTNHYEVLGVSKNATVAEIKTAYRKKALKCHPDKTQTLPEHLRNLAEEEFKKLNNAHAVLSDPTRRQQYDLGESGHEDIFFSGTHTYTSHSTPYFLVTARNNRVKLTGSSQTDTTVHDGNYANQTSKITLQLAKESLDPMLQRLTELEASLSAKAFRSQDNGHLEIINLKYAAVAYQITAMSCEIGIQMNTLQGEMIDHHDMLRALRASQAAVQQAQTEGEIFHHRGFVRNCPILRELCICLDLIVNFLSFLDKKIGKIISNDQTPVFANRQDFKNGMFKPPLTNTAQKVEDLKGDIEWYIQEIELRYQEEERPFFF